MLAQAHNEQLSPKLKTSWLTFFQKIFFHLKPAK